MPSCSSRITWYGPATRVTKYVDRGGVGAKSQRDVPSPPDEGSTAGALPMTTQSDGAVTCTVYGALRSGWSKQA